LHNETEAKFWWACAVDGMNRDQLELFKKALEELKKLVIQHAAAQTLPFFCWQCFILEHLFSSSAKSSTSSNVSTTIFSKPYVAIAASFV